MATTASARSVVVGERGERRPRGSGRRSPRCPGRSRRPAGCCRRAAGRGASSGSVSGPSATARRPSRSTTLPRSVLRNDAGASEISFSRKCGKSPRSMSRVVISACWSSSACTGSGVPSNANRSDAVERAGVRGVEHHDLAPGGRGALGVGRRLAVHAQVGGRLLDQAVGLAGDDEGVLGQPDVERLAAAPQREAAAGRARRRSARRWPPSPRARDTVVRNASSTLAPGRQAPGDERGDHLGVGGDLGRDLRAPRAP